MTLKREKKPFLTIKNRTFQSLNYHIFPKGLTQALAFFNKKHALTCFQKSDFWDFEILNFLTQKQDSFLSKTLLNIFSNPVLNAKNWEKTGIWPNLNKEKFGIFLPKAWVNPISKNATFLRLFLLKKNTWVNPFGKLPFLGLSEILFLYSKKFLFYLEHY